jgi:hypothetical protein
MPDESASVVPTPSENTPGDIEDDGCSYAWMYNGGAKKSFTEDTRMTEFYGKPVRRDAGIFRDENGMIRASSMVISHVRPASGVYNCGESASWTLLGCDFDNTLVSVHEPSTVLGGTVNDPPLSIFFNQEAGEEFTNRTSDTALFSGRAPPENGVIVDKKKWGTSVYTAHVTS